MRAPGQKCEIFRMRPWTKPLMFGLQNQPDGRKKFRMVTFPSTLFPSSKELVLLIQQCFLKSDTQKKAPSCATNCPFLHQDSFSTIYLKGHGKAWVAKFTLIEFLLEINDFSVPYNQSIYTTDGKKKKLFDIPGQTHNSSDGAERCTTQLV